MYNTLSHYFLQCELVSYIVVAENVLIYLGHENDLVQRPRDCPWKQKILMQIFYVQMLFLWCNLII